MYLVSEQQLIKCLETGVKQVMNVNFQSIFKNIIEESEIEILSPIWFP